MTGYPETASLHSRLEHLYRTFDLSMLAPDPLEAVRRFSSPEDREVAGLLASVLAYGRAENIVTAVERVFRLMDGAPSGFIRHFDAVRDAARFRSFIYRFSRGTDIACLCFLIQRALHLFGSLERLFARGYRPDHPHTGPALTHFTETLLSFGYPGYPDGVIPPDAGVRYFLPSPRSGSACKRMNLFLRWVVRKDGIDLGLWHSVSPAKLIIPLDTHIARLSRQLGLTTRRHADWKMAEEITGMLRRLDPDDPVKYDLALCHWGMRQSRGLED
jgi:uncharacterized protein (TIGR02757 family)